MLQISARMTSLSRPEMFLLETVQNEGWSTGVVHEPGPRRGPWTGSTAVVHGPGIYVFYMFLKTSTSLEHQGYFTQRTHVLLRRILNLI